jgi:hypothetical protein
MFGAVILSYFLWKDRTSFRSSVGIGNNTSLSKDQETTHYLGGSDRGGHD